MKSVKHFKQIQKVLLKHSLVMSLFIAILRHTVRRATGTKPVLHACLTRWPFPTGQANLVSNFVTVKVTIIRVVLRETRTSAALSKPMWPANLPSLIITRVVSTRVIPRYTLHAATGPVVVLIARQLQIKRQANASVFQGQTFT